MSKTIYNHDAKTMTEACGITEERLEEILKEGNNLLKKATSPDTRIKKSVLIEQFEKTFNKVELSLLLAAQMTRK